MARFILDVWTDDIQAVLDILDKVKILEENVSSIRCIDESLDNQFYSHDTDTSPLMNRISEQQLKNDLEILKKY
jgi:hypothetical protein